MLLEEIIETQLAYIFYEKPVDVKIRERVEYELGICGEELKAQMVTAFEVVELLEAARIPYLCDCLMAPSLYLCWLLRITKANPLPPHYYCPRCHEIQEWVGGSVDGFDLPPKTCSCGEEITGDGHDLDPHLFSWSPKHESMFAFSVLPKDLPRCQSLAPQGRFNQISFILEVQEREYPDFLDRGLRFTQKIACEILRRARWSLDYDSARLAATLQQHMNAPTSDQDIYRYLMQEYHLSSEDALRYSKRIDHPWPNKHLEEIFSRDSWQYEYYTHMDYSPRKTRIIERMVSGIETCDFRHR